MVRLGVAVNHQRWNKQGRGWEDDGESFPRVAVFGATARNVAASGLRKGMPVVIVGSIRERPYEDRKTGEKKRPWEVKADTVAVDLQFAVVGNIAKPDGGQSSGPRNDAPYAGQGGASGADGAGDDHSPYEGGYGPENGAHGRGRDPWGGSGYGDSPF